MMSSLRKITWILGITLIALECTSLARASCAQNKAASYDNVSAVRYGRVNCFGMCRSYEVLFTSSGECYYTGFRNGPREGAFRGACTSGTFFRAVSTLKKHTFYTLGYDSSILVTDAPHYIISVERCGVTTVLDWPAYEKRKDIDSLFDDLDLIVASVRWRKVSNSFAPPLPCLRFSRPPIDRSLLSCAGIANESLARHVGPQQY
jgi:hypothetical protein